MWDVVTYPFINFHGVSKNMHDTAMIYLSIKSVCGIILAEISLLNRQIITTDVNWKTYQHISLLNRVEPVWLYNNCKSVLNRLKQRKVCNISYSGRTCMQKSSGQQMIMHVFLLSISGATYPHPFIQLNTGFLWLVTASSSHFIILLFLYTMWKPGDNCSISGITLIKGLTHILKYKGFDTQSCKKPQELSICNKTGTGNRRGIPSTNEMIHALYFAYSPIRGGIIKMLSYKFNGVNWRSGSSITGVHLDVYMIKVLGPWEE